MMLGMSIISHASMPVRFWDEVFFSSISFIKKLPIPILSDISPLEKLFFSKPKLSFPCLRLYAANKLEA